MDNLLKDGIPVDQIIPPHDNQISEIKDCSSKQELKDTSFNSIRKINGVFDKEFIEQLDKYSIEDIVEIKISRFLDQIGTFQLENMHELIMSKIEKPLITQILHRVGGNQVQAAKILGINRNTLRKKIKMYSIH